MSRFSRDVCYAIKAGQPRALTLLSQRLKENVAERGSLIGLFGGDVTVVPVPRNAPRVSGGLWPSELICKVIVDASLAKRVCCHLERMYAVQKSSHATTGARPRVHDHYHSMRAVKLDKVVNAFLLVDDVITKGATALAAASRLSSIYPGIPIKLFAAIRTRGLIPEIESVLDPTTGIIEFSNRKTNRKDFT